MAMMGHKLRLKTTDYTQVANMRYLTLFKYGGVKTASFWTFSDEIIYMFLRILTRFSLVRGTYYILIFNKVENAVVNAWEFCHIKVQLNITFIKTYPSVDDACIVSI